MFDCKFKVEIREGVKKKLLGFLGDNMFFYLWHSPPPSAHIGIITAGGHGAGDRGHDPPLLILNGATFPPTLPYGKRVPSPISNTAINYNLIINLRDIQGCYISGTHL